MNKKIKLESLLFLYNFMIALKIILYRFHIKYINLLHKLKRNNLDKINNI